MKSHPSSQQSVISTFIVQIWQEWSLNHTHWRGRVEHLQSGQTLGFQDLDRLITFFSSLDYFSEEKTRDGEEKDN